MCWSAWGVDVCATFAPEYKDTVNDTMKDADVDAVLLVREVQCREKRDGSSFFRLVLGDRSGTPGLISQRTRGVRRPCMPSSSRRPTRGRP